MSTAPTPVVNSAVHASWYSRAGTWFLKVGHAIKGAILKISSEMPAVQAEIAKVAPTVEAISEMLLPGSSLFEEHLLNVWGVAANAVKDAGAAASGNAINITLDAALIDDIRSFLPQVEKYLHPSASTAPAPVSLPAPAAAPAAGGSMTFGQPAK
jgi:hypothetical protein